MKHAQSAFALLVTFVMICRKTNMMICTEWPDGYRYALFHTIRQSPIMLVMNLDIDVHCIFAIFVTAFHWNAVGDESLWTCRSILQCKFHRIV